jgi:hypothetical protein
MVRLVAGRRPILCAKHLQLRRAARTGRVGQHASRKEPRAALGLTVPPPQRAVYLSAVMRLAEQHPQVSPANNQREGYFDG